MTTVEALALIWITTMVTLGFAWVRGDRWKARHDFDHALAGRLYQLVQTMEATDATWKLQEKWMKDDDGMKVWLERAQ